MGQFVKGQVVILPFLFSDLSATKRRPARVFTADTAIIARVAGQLSQRKIKEVTDRLIKILSQ